MLAWYRGEENFKLRHVRRQFKRYGMSEERTWDLDYNALSLLHLISLKSYYFLDSGENLKDVTKELLDTYYDLKITRNERVKTAI